MYLQLKNMAILRGGIYIEFHGGKKIAASNQLPERLEIPFQLDLSQMLPVERNPTVLKELTWYFDFAPFIASNVPDIYQR